MNLSPKTVLTEKKGIAEALGAVMIGMIILVSAGVVVGNFAILSKQASELTSVKQEITNRAELYASQLNTDLLHPQVPPTDRECSVTPPMCTTILFVTPSSDGTSTVLRIQGDTAATLGQSVTKDVTLVSSQVTHVTAIDANGNNVWARSNEGLVYTTWGVASGKPSDVTPDELAGPTAGATWVSTDDRAGVDSTGALWVWGADDIGQAGIGSTSAAPVAPQKITTATFRSVVTDDSRGYAIDSSFNAWVWGKNDQGQLGLGNNNAVTAPTKIPGMRFMSLAIGKNNVFGITTAGDLVVAGASQAGLPANSGYAWQTVNPGTKYKAVAASPTGAVAMIDAAGNLTMVGNGYPFGSPSAHFVSVSLGGSAGYAISDAGVLYSWGTGTNGQLGQGATTSIAQPTQIMAGVAKVQGGPTSALVIDDQGGLYYVGKTPSGYVGGTDLPQVNTLTKLMSGITFSSIAAEGDSTAAALRDSAGNVYGMGTATPGLWPINYQGPANQPIRMPVPGGFSSFTWK